MILPPSDVAHIVKHVRSWRRLRGKRLFLAGASGFVGTWLTESFQAANEQLALGASLSRIPRHAFPGGDFDLGIHAARADTLSSDIQLTKRVLDFAADRGVSRLLFTSSGAVYGPPPDGTTHLAEDSPCHPASSYGKAKRAGELMCAEYNFCSVIARMFAFVGPLLPLNLNFAIGNFLGDVIEGRPVTINGDGTALRSYLYAADLAIWLWTLLLEGESARPYNVGSPDAISIAQLARIVVQSTKPDTPIRLLGMGRSDVYVPCVDRARNELQLFPLISLAQGIRRTYSWNLALKEREMAVSPATTT